MVNAGEFAKATNALLTCGTAPIDEPVLAQLQSKHPPRKQDPQWPTQIPIQHGTGNEDSYSMDVDEDSKLNELPMTDRASNSPMCDEQEEPRTFPSLTVSKDDILTAVSSSKRLTSGGLQQISPWHLKRAMTATSNEDCATTAALLATQWARGDFPSALGSSRRIQNL